MFERIRNIFTRVVDREHETDTKLGMPLSGSAHRRRLDTMSRMTGGNGFTVPAKEPETDKQGRTRGERKRALRAATMEKVSETREPKFMHSAARRRLAGEQPRQMTGFPMQVAA
ncbi:hypothetical protein [Pseudaminobacter sp. NGMCC 1.201702]|uniref:hypothetical protein n=1 Tax=Pseudaminobacter sp. NGMCC 1.201702 TaxID=3391825 RepID=UPI0039EED900